MQCTFVLFAAGLMGLGQLSSDQSQREIAVVAVGIAVDGWGAGVAYEVLGARGVTLGKRLVRLRVIDGASGRRPTSRQAIRRWLAVAAVQPLVWLLLYVRGAEPVAVNLLFRTAIAGSVAWRLVLLASISGTTSMHDRFAGTAVVRSRK